MSRKFDHHHVWVSASLLFLIPQVPLAAEDHVAEANAHQASH